MNSFTQLPPAPMQEGGGFGNAIIGTLTMVFIGAVLSIPVGILSAIYLAILGPESKTATLVRFTAKILSGLLYLGWRVCLHVGCGDDEDLFRTGWRRCFGRTMVPIVILTAEEAFRMVPKKMIEAAIGMGCTPTQAVWKVILPNRISQLAKPGSCWLSPELQEKRHHYFSPRCSATIGYGRIHDFF